MTWDGIPEHRNLGGDGEQPKTTGDYKRQISDWLGSRPEPTPQTAAEFMREQAGRMGWKPPQPEPGQMPADPFSGTDEGAIATVEMFRSHVAAGLTQQQALFYCACLMQVGLAMQRGGLLPPPEET